MIAINNAVSRIGQPLVIAGVFIAITGSFYGSLAAAVPGLDPNDPRLHASIQPLNLPPPGTDPVVAAAARAASADAFYLAVIVSIALLVLGALVNWWGIRGEVGAGAQAESRVEGPAATT